MNQVKKNDIDERRNFPRTDYETKVRCVAINSTDVFITQSQNLSITGICLFTKNPLELDTFYEVMYYNNENQVKKEVAKVKWNTKTNNNFATQGLEFWNHHKLQKNKQSE